jgi:hypothetical protein
VLAELGHTTAAMDVFAQRGDWDRVWEMAAKERVSSSVLAKFAAMRVKQLLDEFSGTITLPLIPTPIEIPPGNSSP